MEQKMLQKAAAEQPKRPNLTGIPTQMKLDLERRSGLSFDDVRVHYHSDQPARFGALAYTQGAQVYIGPGQERHLGHELGHVAQQKLGRVPVQWTAGGLSFNLDPALERDADRAAVMSPDRREAAPAGVSPIQMYFAMDYRTFEQNVRGRMPGPMPVPITKNNAQDYLDFFSFEKEAAFLSSLIAGDEKTKFEGLCENVRNRAAALPDAAPPPQPQNSAAEDQFLQAVRALRAESIQIYKNLYSLELTEISPDDAYGYGVEANRWLDGVPAAGGRDLRKEKIDRDTFVLYRAAETAELTKTRMDLHSLAYGDGSTVPLRAAAPGPFASESTPIGVIPFSKAQAVMPLALSNLIREIYWKWKSNKVFDRRTRQEKAARSTNSNIPGSLRSYHMNLTGSLPYPLPSKNLEVTSAAKVINRLRAIKNDKIKLQLGGGSGSALHAHYSAASKQEGNAELYERQNAGGGGQEPHPIGFAEYTGIGFGGEPHDCKIVLNYITGDIYLTLTHYQYYSLTKGSIVTKGQRDYTDFSPWFKIDMGPQPE